MIREISADEFDERYAPLARAVEKSAGWPRPFAPEHFFAEWQKYLRLGIARVWANDSRTAALGAFFVPNAFCADPVAYVVFWWASEASKESLGLLKCAETAARAAGSVAICTASFGPARALAMRRLYRRLGYQPHEETFRKLLVAG